MCTYAHGHGLTDEIKLKNDIKLVRIRVHVYTY
jgi:hypothetical protein